jgi:hypothetical protein
VGHFESCEYGDCILELRIGKSLGRGERPQNTDGQLLFPAGSRSAGTNAKASISELVVRAGLEEGFLPSRHRGQISF